MYGGGGETACRRHECGDDSLTIRLTDRTEAYGRRNQILRESQSKGFKASQKIESTHGAGTAESDRIDNITLRENRTCGIGPSGSNRRRKSVPLSRGFEPPLTRRAEGQREIIGLPQAFGVIGQGRAPRCRGDDDIISCRPMIQQICQPRGQASRIDDIPSVNCRLEPVGIGESTNGKGG